MINIILTSLMFILSGAVSIFLAALCLAWPVLFVLCISAIFKYSMLLGFIITSFMVGAFFEL